MSKFLGLHLGRFVPSSLLALAAAMLLAPTAASATVAPYKVMLKQQGPNVVAIGSGAFDLTGSDFLGDYPTSPFMRPSANATEMSTGDVTVSACYGITVSGPSNFGTGQASSASVGSGNPVFFTPSATACVPLGYNSGSALSSSATWDNASFASLGVTPGTYTWTWGTGADQKFTLDIVSAVPEPATLGMFGFGILLIGGFVGLRRRVA